MTVIAWDGRTLAADKRVTCNGYPATTTKITRAPDGALIGGAGDSDAIAVLRKWYMDGASPDAFPNNGCDGDCRARLLVITPSGQVTMYLSEPVPITLDDKRFAIGSGADFALAALHLGHTARKAVEIACALDTGCGNGIDVLRLK
jgi:20S proteasome alpha/beta subunit